MQHSIPLDSFCAEDELFFGSYEAEPVNGTGALTPELNDVEARLPTAAQLAHFSRFRRPVAWVVAAMSSLSLVALAVHGSRQSSRRELAAQVGSASAVVTPAAANHLAALSALPGRSVFARAAEQTSDLPWSWSELAESALALVVEPTPPSASAGKQSLLAASATQASQVNDFTSALLSMCRNAPS